MKLIRILFFGTSAILMLFLWGCEDEEDLGPAPVTEFDTDRRVVEVGEIISFQNSSTIDDGSDLTYEWDFGDGTSSTNPNPSKSYTSTGEYPVTLTAISQGGQRINFTDTVTVGQRYLTGLSILILPFERPDPESMDPDPPLVPWDNDGTGPDVVVFFGRSSAAEWDFDSQLDNLTADDLPVSYDFSSESYLLSGEDYDLFLVELDEGQDPELTLMFGGTFAGTSNQLTYHFVDEQTIDRGKDPETGEGILLLQNSVFAVVLAFEIRA